MRSILLSLPPHLSAPPPRSAATPPPPSPARPSSALLLPALPASNGRLTPGGTTAPDTDTGGGCG
ncbi:unnamed protein product, partial [Closterium sp. NIES-54]